MHHEVKCPKCTHLFPVTHARHSIGVDCPRCDGGMTVDFHKRPIPIDPGLSPYEVSVRLGKPVSTLDDELPRKMRLDDDDDDEGVPASGASSILVVFAAVGSLSIACCGLIATGYFLYTNYDSSPVAGNRNPGSSAQPAPLGINSGKQPVNESPASLPLAPSSTPKKTTLDLNPVMGRAPAIQPPALAAEASVIQLPGRVGAVAIAGGGRWIAMHFPDRGMLGVFDASTGLITATECFRGDLKLAAGLSRIVLFNPRNNQFRVYDIPEPPSGQDKLRLVKLYDVPVSFNRLQSMVIGSQTNGPMLALDQSAGVHLLDLQADGITEIEEARQDNFRLTTGWTRASPTGRQFLTFDNYDLRVTMKTAFVEDHHWKKKEIPLAPFPGLDERLYGRGRIIDWNGQELFRGEPDLNQASWYVPAVCGKSGAFVKVSKSAASPDGRNSSTLTIHNRDNAARPAPGTPTLVDVPELYGLLDASGNPSMDLPLDARIFLFPEARLLATISGSKDRMILRQWK